MKHSYRNHSIEIEKTERQTIYDIYENFRGHIRLILSGFFQGDVDEDSLLIRLRTKVDSMLLEPPPTMPSMWSTEFRKD